MTEQRRREDWWHTSSILAQLHNVNVAKRSDLVRPRHYNPMMGAQNPMTISKEEFRAMAMRAFPGSPLSKLVAAGSEPPKIPVP